MMKFVISTLALGIFLNFPITSTLPQVKPKLDKGLMLRLVNQKREKGCNCGGKFIRPVPPLKWNDSLALAALVHSRDMNYNRFFDHRSYNGKTLRDRIEAVGFKWMAIAENIAFGQKDEETVVNSWIKSKGHCENIMNVAYKEMGVARDGIYWTQDFGTKRNW